MKKKYRVNLVMKTILILIALIASACNGSNPEQIATAVADDWTKSAIDTVASELGNSVAGQIPVISGLAGSVIRDQLENNIRWSLSAPIRSSEARFNVKATASSSVSIDIPFLPDQTFDIEGAFDLDIDTDGKRVIRSKLDLGSLSVRRR